MDLTPLIQSADTKILLVVMDGLGGFERKDKATLQREFARTLASLKMSPKDLKARIDFQKEREGLLQEQHRALELKIGRPSASKAPDGTTLMLR